MYCVVYIHVKVYTRTHIQTHTHAYSMHIKHTDRGLFDTFTNLQSRSALEDRKDNDVSFEQIGS